MNPPVEQLKPLGQVLFAIRSRIRPDFVDYHRDGRVEICLAWWVPEDCRFVLSVGRSFAVATRIRDSALTVVKSVCPLDCPDTCSMRVTVEDGVAVELRGDPEHPFTRGFLCQKMARYLDRVYSPDRLLQPLRRVGPKGEGRFERIGWDEALDDDRRAVRRDRRARPTARRRSCPTATTARWASSRRAASTGGSSTGWGRRCSTGRSAPRPGRLGYEYTVGRGRLGADPMAVPECKFIVNWGSNTANTNSHLWSLMIEARKAGATIVTIDPYRSPTAAPSDWHIQPRPGTDAALALGLMHVIWRDGLQDDDYLERGDRRRRAAPRRASSTSTRPRRSRRSPASTSRRSRRSPTACAREQPSLIRLNYGLQRHRGGGMAVRTIACLPAIVGAWRHPGGGALLSTSGTYDFAMDRLTRPDLVAARHAHRQHEPARRGPRRRAARPAGPGPLRLQLQPGRRRPQPGQGPRGAASATTCSPSSTSSSRPTPSTTPTSSCPRRRSSSTSTSTARTAITT